MIIHAWGHMMGTRMYKTFSLYIYANTELTVASDLWLSLLCYGDDASICSKIWPGTVWIILSRKPTAIWCNDRGWYSFKQNSPCTSKNLWPNARSKVGDIHGKVSHVFLHLLTIHLTMYLYYQCIWSSICMNYHRLGFDCEILMIANCKSFWSSQSKESQNIFKHITIIQYGVDYRNH